MIRMKKNAIYSIVMTLIIILGCIACGNNGDAQMRNECPNIIPSIMEWEARQGSFIVQSANIVVSVKDMDIIEPIAIQLQKEYKEITGIELNIKTGNKFFLKDGDIYLGVSSKKKLQVEESYICSIIDKIVIEGKDEKAVFWGTRTLLQMLVQNPKEIVRGTIYDFPEYEIRGVGIDVARHPMSLDSLKMIIQIMSYYKMNDLHLHLNDNELLCYSDKLESVQQSLEGNYSAFRLESNIVNDNGKSITSEDFCYSKEDFRELILYAQDRGINIVPEIDTPAHSLAITKCFPELCNYDVAGLTDILNINDEKTINLVRNIWEEAIADTFVGCNVVHMGMDESYFNGDDYSNYANKFINLGYENEKKVRIWGSMTKLGCTANLANENVQVNIWQTDWASPKEVFETGFDLINTVNENLYIIPAGGYDYLDNEYIYATFEPNKFETADGIFEIPKDSEQMLGATMFVWNDFCGSIDMGITEFDVIDRIEYSIPYFAQKVWGSINELSYEEFGNELDKIKEVPNCKLYQKPEKAGVLYPPYEVNFRVKDNLAGTWLFDSEVEYGKNALVINEEGKLQCLMEFREHTFEYFPQENDEILICGEKGITSLWVNGELIEQMGTNEISELHGTFVFPMGVNETMIQKNEVSYTKR